MIEYNIVLKYDADQDWCDELIKVDDIRIKINILVNMVADQMAEREDNQWYPNEKMGILIDYGKKIWTE